MPNKKSGSVKIGKADVPVWVIAGGAALAIVIYLVFDRGTFSASNIGSNGTSVTNSTSASNPVSPVTSIGHAFDPSANSPANQQTPVEPGTAPIVIDSSGNAQYTLGKEG